MGSTTSSSVNSLSSGRHFLIHSEVGAGYLPSDLMQFGFPVSRMKLTLHPKFGRIFCHCVNEWIKMLTAFRVLCGTPSFQAWPPSLKLLKLLDTRALENLSLEKVSVVWVLASSFLQSLFPLPLPFSLPFPSLSPFPPPLPLSPPSPPCPSLSVCECVCVMFMWEGRVIYQCIYETQRTDCGFDPRIPHIRSRVSLLFLAAYARLAGQFVLLGQQFSTCGLWPNLGSYIRYSCISGIYIMVHNSYKVARKLFYIWRVTTWGTVSKSRSIRKAGNLWSRVSPMSGFPVIICILGLSAGFHWGIQIQVLILV